MVLLTGGFFQDGCRQQRIEIQSHTQRKSVNVKKKCACTMLGEAICQNVADLIKPAEIRGKIVGTKSHTHLQIKYLKV